MNLLLIGYRGSGKTTVGKLLAKRLKMRFVDSDEEIVGRAGKTIADIFRDDGEGYFRDLETQVLRDLLAVDGQVLALGGGVVIREEKRAAMRNDEGEKKVFYLHCEPDELYRRITADVKTAANRPALTHLGGSAAEIEHLLSIRMPLYRETMTHEIDVTHLTAEQAAEAIVTILSRS